MPRVATHSPLGSTRSTPLLALSGAEQLGRIPSSINISATASAIQFARSPGATLDTQACSGEEVEGCAFAAKVCGWVSKGVSGGANDGRS